jgi:hypothetical protein
MSRFHSRLLPALMGLAMIAVAGCDDDAVTNGPFVTLGPSSLKSSPAFVSSLINVSSPSVRAQRIGTGFCPAQPPFLAPINLVFRERPSDLFFTGMHLQFVDRAGGREPLRRLTQIDLFDRFGTTLVPAFEPRTFEFGFPFGCFGASTGTLEIVVFASDSSHRETRTTLHLVIE